jgi:hypothetical protein
VLVGEFSPPRELAAIAAPRVAGRGRVEVGPAGLSFDGRVVDAPSPIPPWSSVVVLIAALLVYRFVPGAERVLLPGTAVLVAGLLWLRYRAETGQDRVYAVPWADLEHVARLPASPDVLAFVLARPLGGNGGPEQVFFAATEGMDALVGALRECAPPTLSWDLHSADRGEPDEAEG